MLIWCACLGGSRMHGTGTLKASSWIPRTAMPKYFCRTSMLRRLNDVKRGAREILWKQGRSRKFQVVVWQS